MSENIFAKSLLHVTAPLVQTCKHLLIIVFIEGALLAPQRIHFSLQYIWADRITTVVIIDYIAI